MKNNKIVFNQNLFDTKYLQNKIAIFYVTIITIRIQIAVIMQI